MNDELKTLKKEKEFLLCVDSDGCAINTMEVKHVECFGPKMIEVWGLEEIKEEAIEVWNYVNLYSLYRGINRFKGLVKALELLQEKHFTNILIPNFVKLKEWAENSERLSNEALEEEYNCCKDEALKKALIWSKAVNASIALLDKEQPSFSYVKESLELATKYADIIVVSSANAEAIEDEWQHLGLDRYVKVMAGQEMGSKKDCIRIAKEDKYENTQVLMIGDAPGDYEAAKANNILYYPIIPGRESQSWKRFFDEALNKFISKEYEGVYQNKLAQEFIKVLTPKG
ncbi:HAD family hydrolase [Clostridium sp. DL1XJH146]